MKTGAADSNHFCYTAANSTHTGNWAMQEESLVPGTTVYVCMGGNKVHHFIKRLPHSSSRRPGNLA